MKSKKTAKHIKAIRRKLKKHGAVVIGVHFSYDAEKKMLYLDPSQTKRLFFLDNHVDGLPFSIVLRDKQQPNVKVWPDLPPAPVTSVPQDDTMRHGIIHRQRPEVTPRDNTDDH